VRHRTPDGPCSGPADRPPRRDGARPEARRPAFGPPGPTTRQKIRPTTRQTARPATSRRPADPASIRSRTRLESRNPKCSGCGSTVQAGQISGIGGQCVDDSGSGTANGNPVIVYGCTGNANQDWSLPGDGTVRTLDKCLDVPGSAKTEGTYVDLSSCNGSAGQQWAYRTSGSLVNPNSGYCLDAFGGASSGGTELDIWACGTNQANQTWSLPQ
jgi:alpha-galactosidase